MNNIPQDLLRDWNILVVDDEPDSLLVADYILTFYGAKVYTAQDGKQALDMIPKIQPRFVISDLSMPIMDGWEMVRLMKDNPIIADIPVIALTAHAMSGDRQRAISAGFHQYLTKPLSAETFISDLLRVVVEIPVLSGALNFNKENL